MESFDSLESYKKRYSEAYKLISGALSLEEVKNYSGALELYKKGKQMLQDLQNFEFAPNEWEQAAALHHKTWKTFQMVAHRIKILSPSTSVTSKTPTSSEQTTNTAPLSFLGNFGETLATLLKGDLVDETMTRSQQVETNRNTAQNLLQQVQKDPIVGTNLSATSPHLGLPQSVPELADMIIEASLLPSPLKGNGRGTVPPDTRRIPISPLEEMKKTQFFINSMAKEPQRKWEQIQWRSSIDTAISDAEKLKKPIFIELVVGRLGQKESTVC